MDRAAIIGYAAAGLGALSFVWGFLTWYSSGPEDVSGYTFAAGAIVVPSLAAGLIALGAVLEHKPLTTVPAALAIAATLASFGTLVSHDAFSTSAGLILAFVTVLVQAGVLSYGYLEVHQGRAAGSRDGAPGAPAGPGSVSTSSPGRSSDAGAPGDFGSSGGPGGFGGAGGYGSPGGYGPPPGYGAPPSYGPGGAPSYPQGGYGGPDPYGSPAPSGYGPSTGYGTPSGYGQPTPPADETESRPAPPSPRPAGAHETAVIPRFPGPDEQAQGMPPGSPAPEQDEELDRSNATQHIPRFDPPPNPYARPPQDGPHER